MADRVPEVQHLAAPRVALVGGDDRELGARAREDRALVHLVARPRPAPTARRRRSARSSAPRPSRPPAPPRAAWRACRDRRSPRPAGGRRRRSSWPGADRRRSCRRRRSRPGRQGGGDVHDRHAALVGGGAEAGQIADDAAPERHHVIGAGHPGRRPARARRARRWRASCAPRPGAIATSPEHPRDARRIAPRRSRR